MSDDWSKEWIKLKNCSRSYEHGLHNGEVIKPLWEKLLVFRNSL